jgi:hypothetical protein
LNFENAVELFENPSLNLLLIHREHRFLRGSKCRGTSALPISHLNANSYGFHIFRIITFYCVESGEIIEIIRAAAAAVVSVSEH